jgi:hypothetical protein
MTLSLLALTLAAVCPSAPRAAVAERVTYCKDVAPILFRHCAPCHRPGEVAPFPLLSYKDAARRARHLAEVTADRRMPPWPPESGPLKLLDERRLSEAEVRTLARWAAAGAPEGDRRDLPPAPKFTEGWQLGKPDLVVKMPRPFTVPADGPDIYQGFTIPIPLDGPRWVKGFEFRPGNRRLIHHAILMLDTSGELRKLAEKENGPGFRLQRARAELLPLKVGGASIGEWNPGRTPRFLPDGIARAVTPGTDLVLLIHYHPSGKVEQDQSCLGLYFTDRPGHKALAHLAVRVAPELGNAGLLDIPAGKKDHRVVVVKEMPGDGFLYTMTPHAHYLLKELRLTATPPGGKAVPLLRIDRWDFEQQERYAFADPPRFPQGTRLELSGRFDNSADNPLNPSSPPRAVHWGENTTDEMFGVALRILPDGKESALAYRHAGEAEKAANRLRLPPGGWALPPEAALIREKYDKDHDGVLSQKELDAMPEPVRRRVEELIRERLAADSKSQAKAGGALRLPPGGFPLPREATLLREKYDKDGDGKLSQAELEAIPQPLRARVEELIRNHLAQDAAPAAGAGDKKRTKAP